MLGNNSLFWKQWKKRKRTKHLSCLPTQTSSKYLMKKIFSLKKYSQIINEEEKIEFSLSLILKNPGSDHQLSVTTQQRQPNIDVPRLKKKKKKKRTYHLWSSFAKINKELNLNLINSLERINTFQEKQGTEEHMKWHYRDAVRKIQTMRNYRT